jgi:hypothetical protein
MQSRSDWAFGDEPVVIYRGERLRWVNADTLAHQIVADVPDATDFQKTDELAPNGGEQSFNMTRLGTTRIRCATHPNMTGTLTVRTLALVPNSQPTHLYVPAHQFDTAAGRRSQISPAASSMVSAS